MTIIYNTELLVWMRHANLPEPRLAALAGVETKEVVDFCTGRRPVPAWAVTICKLSAALLAEAKIDDVCEYLCAEPDLEPFEILGLYPEQVDDLSFDAAVEALKDRYGKSEKLDQAASEWLMIRG